jgi:hypothetical protein
VWSYSKTVIQTQAIKKLAPLPETRAARHTWVSKLLGLCNPTKFGESNELPRGLLMHPASKAKHLSPNTCLQIGFLPWLHILTNVMHDTADAVRAHANLPSPRILLLEASWRPPVAVPVERRRDNQLTF